MSSVSAARASLCRDEGIGNPDRGAEAAPGDDLQEGHERSRERAEEEREQDEPAGRSQVSPEAPGGNPPITTVWEGP